MELADFVLDQLPPPPAPVRVAGSTRLVLRLRTAGYEPRVRTPVAAAVAEGLPGGKAELGNVLDEVVTALAPGGVFVLETLAWDLLDAATAEWLHGQLRLLAASGRSEQVAKSLEEFQQGWRASHEALPTHDELRAGLDARFEQKALAWTPMLWRLLSGPASMSLEQTLVEAGMIRGLGLRYAGVRR